VAPTEFRKAGRHVVLFTYLVQWSTIEQLQVCGRWVYLVPRVSYHLHAEQLGLGLYVYHLQTVSLPGVRASGRRTPDAMAPSVAHTSSNVTCVMAADCSDT
jgi:hypothetical protein